MGWFWADTTPTASRIPPHPMPSSDASPPPGCPMHNPSNPSPPSTVSSTTPSSACPYTPPDKTLSAITPATQTPPPPESSQPRSTLSKLNPLNYMFSDLSQSRAPNQTTALPTSREASTIPRGDGSGTWEYPSPQQMYNAMLRKGYTDTPSDAVESMVAVHNFLNEGAWGEIIEWERRFGRGLAHGWRACARGEDGSVHGAMLGTGEWEDKSVPEPRLVRFMGRPSERTPKASLIQALGWAWPSRFASEAPFDRHDWFVRRCDEEGRCREVRYVIDYYEGAEDEETGMPVFHLDVRPAVDGPTQACERLMRWGGDIWWRASGGVTRELQKAQEAKAKS
ncbi:hypothetical protein EJ05DRAFT_473739 [Pseudovirgaria hyperparasitica]|uniref:Holocytochrome c-type synthase n=1 Tax=Pseudovirgaria hyperparasitica TaxID=470096 RepID=A0A6A6WHS2_9PEZI|nr:uncharacterized protein EJ05DRAFT_473739 [Pseudovirgaria hyperparasitica]KAF2761197.1 hypothetical protein EJ05DRAFT_473739 [Pseudovirgaria hyperparasitica]